jgi:hypothetical protein
MESNEMEDNHMPFALLRIVRYFILSGRRE